MKTNVICRFLETYIHYALMVIAMLLCTIFLLPFCFVFEKMTFPICTLTSRALLFVLGAKVKIIGEIPKGKSYVIVGNHTSVIDIFTLPIIANGQRFTVFLHEKLLKIPVLGEWLKILNPVAINPATGNGVSTGIRKAISLVQKEKINFFGFPEGTRTTSGEMKKFKTGIFSIAVQSQCDVIPFGSAGAFDFKPKDRWWLKPGKVVIYIGQPICIQGKDKDELASLVESRVSFCIKKAEEFI